MKSRFLPFVNTIGCVILSGVVVMHWVHERNLDKTIKSQRSELQGAQEKAATETERAAGLERDVAALKESIEASQKAADEAKAAAQESARLLAEKTAQADALQTQAATAGEQVKVWEEAIAQRDARIRSLNSDIAATRARLESAISKLKAAGAE